LTRAAVEASGFLAMATAASATALEASSKARSSVIPTTRISRIFRRTRSMIRRLASLASWGIAFFATKSRAAASKPPPVLRGSR